MSELDDRIARLSPAKRELLTRWLAQQPQRPVSAAYAAPRTELEQSLTEIWQLVLERDRVGIDDDYFELGGDSVHAIAIVARAQQLRHEVSVQDLLDGRTVRTVAGLAGPAPSVPAPRSEPEPEAEFPLTPLQQGMLYHAVGGSTPGAYLVQVSCRLAGELDRSAFGLAWRAVFAANPALRAVLRWRDRPAPCQRFPQAMALPVRFLEPGERGAAVGFDELLAEDRQAGFDLEQGPLMRLTVAAEGPATHWCVWTYHHLVMDGWSQQLILRDVFEAYQRLRVGEQPAPPVRPSFVDYLTWLAGKPEVAEEFWQERLAGVSELTRIAGPGCVAGQVVTDARQQQELALSPQLSTGLTALARQHGITIGALMHAGWSLLLSIHSGRDDTVHGATLAGRPPELPGATESIGSFVNTLPLRLTLPLGATVPDWVREAGRRISELAERQHEALSRVERAVGAPPQSGLFDSLVVMENFPTWLRAGDEVAGLRIDALRTVVEEGYPLVLEIGSGHEPVLRARYDPARLDPAEVEALLSALAGYVAEVVAEPQATVGAVRERVAARWREHREDGRRAARQRTDRQLRQARRRPVTGPGGGDR